VASRRIATFWGAQTTKRSERRPATHADSGVCVWLTGLSGSGKTTTAERLRDVIEGAGVVVTLLDGDIVRRHLFPALGFTRADRDRNALGVAWVAAEIVRHGGIVICSLISPYRVARAQARSIVGPEQFLEVFVNAPVEVCEARDVKGLYGRARGGRIAAMTGVDDPYEPPTAPDLTLDAVGRSVDENVREILRVLHERGFLIEITTPDGGRRSAGASVDAGGG
jgi:sulfate adenylyltransferase